MLRSVAAGTVAAAGASKWGDLTDLGPDDWDPGMPALSDSSAPDSITVDGQEIELRPIAGSCEGFARGIQTREGEPVGGRTTAPREITVRPEQIRALDADVEPSDVAQLDLSDLVHARYDITGCNVDADPHVFVYDWRPPYEPTRQCRKAFCEFTKARVQHELEHVKDHENFAPKFEDWVENNRLALPLNSEDEQARVRQATNALRDRYSRLFDQRRFLDTFAHDRVGEGVPLPCDACADCREVDERKNWTYADVKTWKMEVKTTVGMGHQNDDEVGFVESTYDATLYLERVPPGVVARAMGGISSIQDLVGRYRDVRDLVSRGVNPDSQSPGVFNPETPGEALDRALERGEHRDVVSDGQPPLIWTSSGRGSVQGRISAQRKKKQRFKRCGNPDPVEKWILITASANGTVSPDSLDSKAFASILPKKNVIQCFWPDATESPDANEAVYGKHTEYTFECTENGLEPTTQSIDQPFLDLVYTEDRGGYKVYGGVTGAIAEQVQQIRSGSKSSAGFSQAALDKAGKFPETYYSSRSSVTSKSFDRLSQGELPKEVREYVFTRPNVFWEIGECQHGTFGEHFKNVQLYGPDDQVILDRYNVFNDAVADARTRPDQFIEYGTEEIKVNLEAVEFDSIGDHRYLDCYGRS